MKPVEERINESIDLLIAKSQEHVCKGSDCLCNIQNACAGAEDLACSGDHSCQKSKHAVVIDETGGK